MARQTQIQTTYDPSLYNEGVILQADGSVLTKPVNEDGTSDPSKQQTLTEPGKGKITINQTVNGSLSTYEFNVNQKEDQVITLPTINTWQYGMNSELFDSFGTGISHDIVLQGAAIGSPIFQMWQRGEYEIIRPESVTGSGRNWTIYPSNPNAVYDIRVTYLYRTR